MHSTGGLGAGRVPPYPLLRGSGGALPPRRGPGAAPMAYYFSNSFTYFPYPSFSRSSLGMNRNAAEFMQ